jgi:hypothetical protein
MQQREEAMIYLCKKKSSLKKFYKNMVVFALTYVLEILALLYEDFRMNSYSVDSKKGMKRGNEVLNTALPYCYEFSLCL